LPAILLPKEVIESSREKSLEAKRLTVVATTIGISIISLFFLKDKTWSNGNTAAGLFAVNGFLFALHGVYYRDSAFGRLAVFGITFGIVELIADALCVGITKTLSYAPAKSTMIWLSPWWMPGAWAIVSMQIGYLGARLIQKLGNLHGAALCAIIGAVNIPFYEEMAYHAHWWSYHSCRMIGHTPVYIIVAESIIGACLAPLAKSALEATLQVNVIKSGLVAGLSTIIGGLIGYGAIEVVLKNAV